MTRISGLIFSVGASVDCLVQLAKLVGCQRNFTRAEIKELISAVVVVVGAQTFDSTFPLAIEVHSDSHN